jgi:flagellar biosynthesis protein FliP
MPDWLEPVLQMAVVLLVGLVAYVLMPVLLGLLSETLGSAQHPVMAVVATLILVACGFVWSRYIDANQEASPISM